MTPEFVDITSFTLVACGSILLGLEVLKGQNWSKSFLIRSFNRLFKKLEVGTVHKSVA